MDRTAIESLVAKVTNYVKDYMSHYDPSHDFDHIRRVVHLACHIQASVPGTSRHIVILSALLHDVGDKKYLKPGEDGSRLVHDVLISLGSPVDIANTVQAICLGVSYSGEVKDPARVLELIKVYPELAIVQDADRLDAIGAVGIGRTFTFGGAKGRSLEQTMAHFGEKLLHLEGMMKTDAGRQLAKERTDRLRTMQEWWAAETDGIGDVK
ncbi:hydrolase [Durotheca rogersii]|uniref:hydrolase n=1 Tax=Durotheca rogersii TaxID=419775 RepID=UPI00221EE632|nr:hydrolase [Durotheca rogersii]KAI5859273.1 hydrolase [Durotheca rogersii]